MFCTEIYFFIKIMKFKLQLRNKHLYNFNIVHFDIPRNKINYILILIKSKYRN